MLRCHACLVRFEARFRYDEELMEKKEIPVFEDYTKCKPLDLQEEAE